MDHGACVRLGQGLKTCEPANYRQFAPLTRKTTACGSSALDRLHFLTGTRHGSVTNKPCESVVIVFQGMRGHGGGQNTTFGTPSFLMLCDQHIAWKGRGSVRINPSRLSYASNRPLLLMREHCASIALLLRSGNDVRAQFNAQAAV